MIFYTKKIKKKTKPKNIKSKSRSVTPSPSPSPRHSLSERPQALALQRTKGLLAPQQGVINPNTPNTLHPLGLNYRGQLLPSSRQASSNASEGGGVNRESSLDDSGVVDDHDDQDTGVEIIHAAAVGVIFFPLCMFSLATSHFYFHAYPFHFSYKGR